jgi:hypothetical protein
MNAFFYQSQPAFPQSLCPYRRRWFGRVLALFGLLLFLSPVLTGPARAIDPIGPLGRWTRCHPFPNWTAAAFGAGQFVLVGELGSIITSSDGITWSTNKTVIAGYFNDVIFANGQFIAVGELGAIRVSTNGTVWDAVSSHGTTTLTGVAYGNGTYVIVGVSGMVLTSADGRSWTKQTGVSSSLALRSVAYGNNLFIAITGAGEIVESPDGVAWTSQPSQGGNPSKVTCLNNRFLIIDYGMKLSADGTNWTVNYVYPVLTNVIYANGYYLGVGSGIGGGHGGAILSSSDLTNWTTAVDDPRSYGLSAIAYGNGTFVAAGMHGLIRTSTNHLDWPVDMQSLTWLDNLFGIAYINNEFVAGGDAGISPGGYGEDSPLLFSGPPGGNHWTRRPTGFYDGVEGLTYGQGRYVLISAFGVHVSTNGIDWTGLGDPVGHQLTSITYANHLFVLTSLIGGIATSPDGLTWTARTSGTTRDLWGAAYGNGGWVVVGSSGSGGVYVNSSDGQTWTAHNFSAANLRNIVFGSGNFVMVGDSGYAASSTNGTAWTQRFTGAPGAINGICYADGYFLTVGDSGYVGSSSDVTNWAIRISGGTASLQRVAFGGGTFVATGYGGLLQQSASIIPALTAKTVAGGIEVDLVGGLDRNYILQSSTTLAPASWSPLSTLISGQRQFTNTDNSSPLRVFSLTLP